MLLYQISDDDLRKDNFHKLFLWLTNTASFDTQFINKSIIQFPAANDVATTNNLAICLNLLGDGYDGLRSPKGADMKASIGSM